MHRTTVIAITAIILMNIITPPTTTIDAQTSETPIKWVRYINPTYKDDHAFGTCIFGGYIAVVGIADRYPYIVLLNRDSGEIVREWIDEEPGSFYYNCISIGDKLYVVGWTGSVRGVVRGVIYVFDENLNIVDRVMNNESYSSVSAYVSIVYDGSYIYIGGEIYEDVNDDEENDYLWLVEKRTVDLDLVSSRKIYLIPESGFLSDIDVNSVTGDIWVVGWHYAYVNQTYIGHSLIAILNNNLSNVKLIDYSWKHKNYLGLLNSICFDDDGYAYIAAGGGVAKFDPQGNLIAVNKKLKDSRKILCIGSKIYVFRYPSIDGYDRHVLTVLDSDLSIVDEYVLSGDVYANSYFGVGKASFDGESIYVAGVDDALGLGNARIVVYSIAVEEFLPPSPPLPPDFTVTTSTPTTTTQLAPPSIQNPMFIALPITAIAIPFIALKTKTYWINYKKKRDEERIRRRIEKIIRDIDELLNR